MVQLSFNIRFRFTRERMLLLVLIGLSISFFSKEIFAADWPTYRNDISLSAISGEPLESELYLQWIYHPNHPPKPAWPMPSEELPRMHVDNAYHAVLARGKAFFGSCVTNKVYALDAESGEICWTYCTHGPVRFAPTVYEGRVYFGSDDGFAYCLDASDGTLIWKHRAGPSDEKVIGNERMISLWPLRTNVLVDKQVAYFTAGVFPYEGLYICALDAEDGSVLWKNGTIGDYSHELAYGGISPHGYLLASSDILYVPSGRAMPAAFKRETGEFLYYAYPGAKRGGTWTLLDQNRLIAGVDYSGTPHKVTYDAETGQRMDDLFANVPGLDMVVTSNEAFILTRDGILAIDRQAQAYAAKRGNQLTAQRKQLSAELNELREKRTSIRAEEKTGFDKNMAELVEKISGIQEEQVRLDDAVYLWKYPQKNLCSLILAGKTLIAGGDDIVIRIEVESGKEIGRERIQGKAASMAVSDGRLVVSSDEGQIYCYGSQPIRKAKEIKPFTAENPFEDHENSGTYRDAVERIVKECPWDKGYCLVLDCREGQLAYELARRTDLKIIGLEQDREKRNLARQHLEAAGLWGNRVVVEPWTIDELPDYFANLIISDDMLFTGTTDSDENDRFRVLRPWGGVSLLPFRHNEKITWEKSVRDELEGAGSWNQQFCDPQNTACSDDQLVDGPLGLLWFGEPGPIGMVERHANAQSPVALDGRMFMQGEEMVKCVDAFNGSILWKRNIPGAVRVKIKGDGGNLVVTKEGLFIAAHEKCYRLDPETGETIRIYYIPQSDDGSLRRWGYISVDNGILYGSTAEPMEEDYAQVLKTFLRNGEWRDLKDIPEHMKERFIQYKQRYPNPDDFCLATERDALLFRHMTAFAGGGEFTQKNAVTQNLMISDKVFAIDVESGDLRWVHHGNSIAHITVSIGDGKIFFADSDVTDTQRKHALQQRKNLTQAGIYKVREGIREELEEREKMLAENQGRENAANRRVLEYLIESLRAELYENEHPEGILTVSDADVRIVTALDAKTGGKIWETIADFTGCCGDMMGTAYSSGLLFFFGNHGNHDAWRFRYNGMQWRRITALSAENGEMVWSRALNYRTRPVIVGDWIILEPRACDLRTGEIILREHPITGKKVPWEFLRPGHTCGITAASANGLFYRSLFTNFYDLEEDNGVVLFGAYRPGCAISLIPACGVLLSQEAAAGCTCSFPIRCSLAMKRESNRHQPWAVYITPGELTPVQHFAINFGAAADMKDEDGTVWFGYPNPKTSSFTHFPNYGVKFDLADTIQEGRGYFYRDFKGVSIPGTDKPWLFTSGCLGLSDCTIPLLDPEKEHDPGTFTVRLGFLAPPEDKPGQRIFEVRLQDRVMLKDFDIARETNSAQEAIVKEFQNIEVKDVLKLELIPQSSQQPPIINYIEIIREDTTEV